MPATGTKTTPIFLIIHHDIIWFTGVGTPQETRSLACAAQYTISTRYLEFVNVITPAVLSGVGSITPMLVRSDRSPMHLGRSKEVGQFSVLATSLLRQTARVSKPFQERTEDSVQNCWLYRPVVSAATIHPQSSRKCYVGRRAGCQ